MNASKNSFRAAVKPLDVPTLALSVAGLGFLRPAPGTWGSLPPVLLASLLLWLGASAQILYGLAALLLAAASAICVRWGEYAELRFGRKDAAEVVADETAGVCVPVVSAVAIIADGAGPVITLVCAFVLFRVFDIVKPWPARQLERVRGGWGVLLDDLVAGAYAAATLGLVHWLGALGPS